MPLLDGRQVSETLHRYRPTVAVLCMSADPDAAPHIESSDIPVWVLLKPFSSDDLYHAVRDAITRATDLSAMTETEIVRAHAGLSKLARALEESRTTRVQTLDLIVAARELRRRLTGDCGSPEPLEAVPGHKFVVTLHLNYPRQNRTRTYQPVCGRRPADWLILWPNTGGSQPRL